MFFKKSSLAQIFFHDIKNKLGSVKFSLSMLKNPNISTKQKESLLNSLLITVDKAIDVFQDFIETEKFKKARFLKTEKLDLKDLIREILNEFELDIERKKIDVFPNLKSCIIKTNREWLKKALSNIIHNSIKYNTENGKIFIETERQKKGFLITVKDSGVGMDEEEKRNLFKKHRTSGKEHGTGIGLNMSKAVIESFGGAIAFNSAKNTGSVFFIYIPKNSKQVRLKKLAAALSSFTVILFLGADYFLCLIPLKTKISKTPTSVVYELQNGVRAISDKNDEIKITAYRNLFNTRSRTKFIIKKADINIDTASNRITVVANGKTIKNRGTEFETVVKKDFFATSVYQGEIESENNKVKENEGIIYKNENMLKEILPPKIKKITIDTTKGTAVVSWESRYHNFTIVFSKDEHLKKTPVFKYKTAKKTFNADFLQDGKWYVSVQNEKDFLYSKPAVSSFVSLGNYVKALKAYKNGGFDLAETYLDTSLHTIGHDSYKPYILKTKILMKKREFSEALKYAKTACSFSKNETVLYYTALLYYKTKKYDESINILKNMKKNATTYSLLAYDYYEKGDFRHAKTYLYKTLELNADNRKALEYMINIQKKEKNNFLLKYFESKIKETE
ncbi:ATP-binding protein [Nautilia sp.]